MAHSCPECGQQCYCGGDIDDCCFEGTPEERACQHCPDDWDDGDTADLPFPNEFYAEPEGLDMPCTGAFACPCHQCVRELGP